MEPLHTRTVLQVIVYCPVCSLQLWKRFVGCRRPGAAGGRSRLEAELLMAQEAGATMYNDTDMWVSARVWFGGGTVAVCVRRISRCEWLGRLALSRSPKLGRPRRRGRAAVGRTTTMASWNVKNTEPRRLSTTREVLLLRTVHTA